MDLTSGLLLARIRGIEIRVHWSWLFIFTLVTWSLATYYGEEYPEWNEVARYLGGAGTAAMFFVSVLLHELSHAVVAQRFKMQVPSITLFIFGGVSNIVGEMNSARQEFLIAIAGPGMSFVLAGVFTGLALVVGGDVGEILAYLGFVNVILGVFNLLPGFPLDGGRVFRSLLWARSKDRMQATRIASAVGSAIGWIMIAGGILFVLTVSLFGLWYVMIGFFLKSAAEAAYNQLIVERALSRVRAGDLMRPPPTPLHEDTLIQSIVDEHLLVTGERCVLLDRDGGVTGLLTTTDVAKVPRDRWGATRAREVMVPADSVATCEPSTPVATAMLTMAERDVHQLPVLDEGRLVGMLTRGDVLNQLEMRMRLEMSSGAGRKS
ncbi:MAG: site-2 protease family protein [Dehalococcoidia bacterium]|nr:site-2 protease family protein [Dehalococcoidia bacterium]